MGARRTMNLHGLKREKRKKELRRLWALLKDDLERIEYLQLCNKKLQERLTDPEGEVGRQVSAMYKRDLRERELEHHAAWDAEVVVHKMAAARWMRGEAAKVADAEGFFAIGAAIERLPLVPSDG